MKNISKQLIEKELKSDIEKGYVFTYKKLSNKFIDWLFNKYYCHEMCVNFYDSAPEFDDEEYNMYIDYEYKGKDSFKYSKKQHTKEELKQAYDKIKKAYKEYESERILFCNWQEPYFKGNWGMTQLKVDRIAKNTLKEFKRYNNQKDRVYISIKKDEIRIFLYSRDIVGKDVWFIFYRK